MTSFLLLPLASSTGFPWINLVWIILGIVALMFVVAGIGRWCARTHPDPQPAMPSAPVLTPVPTPLAAPTAPVPVPAPAPAPMAEVDDLHMAAAIAAAVYETLGPSAVITSVVLQTPNAVSVENLMLVWSLEGRRQIYTSHKVR